MLVLCCYFLLIFTCWCPIRLVYTVSFLFSVTFSADIHMLVYNSNGLYCFVSLLKFSYSLCFHILLSLHYITSKTNNSFLKSISIGIVFFQSFAVFLLLQFFITNQSVKDGLHYSCLLTPSILCVSICNCVCGREVTAWGV